MEFKTAKLGKIATVVSIATTVFLVGLSIFFIIKVPFGWAFAIFMMLVIIISYLLSPKKYSFEGANLIIEKVIGKKITIPFNEIEGYVWIPDFTKLKVVRTFGNGGLFGYYGMFSTAEYGSVNCQLTSLKNIFIIKSKKGNFALSPLEPDKFEEHLKAIASGMTGEIEIIKPIPQEEMVRANPLILIIPICIFILTIIIILLNYAQLPERIAIHFDFQGNPNGWGSKTSYLIAGIVPSSILFALNIIIFFFARRASSNPGIPNFLVIIMSFIMLFVGYTSFDAYWFNKYNTHLISLPYSMAVFVIIIVLLLLFYYRKIVKTKTS